MNFTVNSTTEGGCRCGTLVSQEPAVTVETPACMLYTRTGSAPHLGYDVLRKIKNLPRILHVPSEHFVELQEILEGHGKGLKNFTCNEDFILYTSLYDPSKEAKSGFNDVKSVAIWGRSGKNKIDTDRFAKLQECMRPDMYQMLSDFDTDKESTKKRIRKSYDSSVRFMDPSVNKHTSSETLQKSWLLGTVGGGYSDDMRTRWAKEMAKRPVDGYVMEGFHKGGPKTEDFSFEHVARLIKTSLRELPEDKPRIMHLIWSPDNVIQGVESGIDLFDSTFPYVVMERGGALNFPFRLDSATTSEDIPPAQPSEVATEQNQPAGGAGGGEQKHPPPDDDSVDKENRKKPKTDHEDQPAQKRSFEINLKDKRFENDRRPLVDGCTCYTCQTHNRYYVQHLLNTSELLGGILLMIHNFHHYFEFFAALRESLKNGTFVKLKEIIINHREQNK